MSTLRAGRPNSVTGSHSKPPGAARVTATVRELCRLAATRYGLHTLKAAATHDNIASRKVLAKNGFVPIGPAELNSKPGTWYERDLTAG